MARFKTIAGVLLLFILGALVGSLGTGWVLKAHHPLFRKDPGQRVEFILDRLTDRLDLTEAQIPQVEAILRRIDKKVRQHFEQQFVEMRRLVDQAMAEIKPLLTPAQQQELDRLRQEFESRRQDRHRGHGPPPPPPGSPPPG